MAHRRGKKKGKGKVKKRGNGGGGGRAANGGGGNNNNGGFGGGNGGNGAFGGGGFGGNGGAAGGNGFGGGGYNNGGGGGNHHRSNNYRGNHGNGINGRHRNSRHGNSNNNNNNNNRSRSSRNPKGPPQDVRKLNAGRMGHCPAPQNPQEIVAAIEQFAVRAVWFDEASNQVVTAGADAKVRFWNLQGAQTKEVAVRGKVWSLHMVPPFLFVGQEVATGQPAPGDKQGLIQAFNTTSAQNWELKMNPQTPFSHGTRVSCMVAKGQFLFSGGGMFPNEPATPDNAIRVWQLQPQTQQFAVAKTMNGHESSIKSMALTSDGAWLVSGDMSGTICTWSSANGNPGNMTRQAHTGNMPFVMSVLPFSGNTLLTASYVHHGNLVCGFCVWTSSFPNSDQRIFSFRNMFCISLLLYYVPSYAPPPPPLSLLLLSSAPLQTGMAPARSKCGSITRRARSSPRPGSAR